MRILAVLVFVLISVGFYIAILDNAEPSNNGKDPADERVSEQTVRNLVTGELLNVKTTRCMRCNTVTSFVECSLNGKVLHGHHYQHKCGHYLVRYNGSGLLDLPTNLITWLDSWQKRLRLKH